MTSFNSQQSNPASSHFFNVYGNARRLLHNISYESWSWLRSENGKKWVNYLFWLWAYVNSLQQAKLTISLHDPANNIALSLFVCARYENKNKWKPILLLSEDAGGVKINFMIEIFFVSPSLRDRYFVYFFVFPNVVEGRFNRETSLTGRQFGSHTNFCFLRFWFRKTDTKSIVFLTVSAVDPKNH